MIAQVIYSAPLPAGFASGTLTIKRAEVYIDQDGRKALPFQTARINSDRTLTDVTTNAPLTAIIAGPGDPASAPLTWTETLTISGLPDAQRSTHDIPATYTGMGVIDLHVPNLDGGLVAGPNNALGAAQEALSEAKIATAQATLAAEIAQQATNQFGSVNTQLNGVTVSDSTDAPLGGTLITLTPAQASSVDATVRPADLGGVVITLGGTNG